MLRPQIKARLIPTPKWTREPETELYEDESEATEAAKAFEPHMPDILDTLHEQIELFFNNPDCTFDTDFPQWSRLTGEYYWGDCAYAGYIEQAHLRSHYRWSQNVRCLEKKWIEHQTDFDYLELEAQILLWRDTGQWELVLGFDTRVI